MSKIKHYNGETLEGNWLITSKLDGVRMLRDNEGNPVSRAGKPLYNLHHIPQYITDAEVFIDNWSNSVSAVRTIDSSPVPLECVYSLSPVDPRLVLGTECSPRIETINEYLDKQLRLGNEGIVIHGSCGKSFKFKENYTIDLTIIGMEEGRGKRAGKVGKLITSKGNVGVFKGFSDKDLEDMWKDPDTVGSIGEFSYMNLTDKGLMRQPKLLRIRFDKDTTDD